MMQQLTPPDAKTQVYVDSLTIMVVEEDICYVYHKQCFGLTMIHPLDVASLINDYREKREIMRHTIRACHCFSEPQEHSYEQTQQVLANLRVSLSVYLEQSGVGRETMEGVREIILRAASRDEMRETQTL